MKIIQFEGTAEEYEGIRETLFPAQGSGMDGERQVAALTYKGKGDATIPEFAATLSSTQREIFHELWAIKDRWVSGVRFAKMLDWSRPTWHGVLGGLARKINNFFNTDMGLDRLIDVGYPNYPGGSPERSYKLKEDTREWWDEVFAHP